MRLRKLAALALGAMLAAGSAQAQDAPPAAYELALVTLDGEREVLGRVPGTAYAPRLSHDGTRVVFDDMRAGGAVLVVAALNELDELRDLPLGRHASNSFPLWSHDDEKILFIAPDGDEQGLFWRNANGSGATELLAKPARAPEAWTPDGAALNFITLTNGDYAISTWRPGIREAVPLLQREGSLQHSSYYSRDGGWLVYASNETGRFEVWVEPIPLTGERYQVTRDGGEHPLWSPDGSMIFFDRAGRMYAVDVTTAGGFAAAEPKALPIEGFAQLSGYRRQFDLMPDGERFLLLYAR